MSMLYPVIIAGVVALVIAVVIIGVRAKASKEPKQKSRSVIIRDAQKKLAQNPHNTQALTELSDLYYEEHLWEKAYPLFNTLFEIAPAHSEVDYASTGLKLGVCALKLDRTEEAMRGLVASYKMDNEKFEINYYLGQACFTLKDYAKAVPCLRKALVLNPAAPQAVKWVGLALYYLKHYKESLPYSKKALEAEPGNKELLFSMAEGLENIGNRTKALQVYQHLHSDPVYGPKASLAAGSLFQSTNELDKAIPEFETGLQCNDIPSDLLSELRYRLGSCYIKSNDIGKGLQYLKALQADSPGYKDVDALVSRYQELNQNSNLQVYLMGTGPDFQTLCKKMAVVFFPKARIRVTDISSQGELTDMLAEIETPKWEDIVLFRFIRSTGAVGELYIRELHAKLKDTKAGRGFYISAGLYQEGARKFVEGRPIDLIDKTQLVKVLQKVGS